MSDTPTKSIGIKFVGSNRSAETLSIEPGTTVQDVMRTLGLGDGGFTLTNPTNPEQIFQPASNLYALVNDGDMLAATAIVDAGLEFAA